MIDDLQPNVVPNGARHWKNRLVDLVPAAVWRAAARRSRRSARWPFCIVAFHRVSDEYQDELTFPVRRFERLCRYWRDHYQVLSLDALFEHLNAGATPAQPSLAITFDDGYADNAEVAAPILARYKLPATFFLTTGFINTSRSFPWDSRYLTKPRMMTWAQVTSLASSGFTFGSHTENHIRLSKAAPDVVMRELYNSLQTLSTYVPRPALDFAYPFGGPNDCNENNRRAIKSMGFRSCFACHGGLSVTSDSPYHLNRISVSPQYHATPAAWERHYARLIRGLDGKRSASTDGIDDTDGEPVAA